VNTLRILFLKMVIYMTQYDIVMEQKRLEHVRKCIEHDKARLLQLQNELLSLEVS